MNNDQESTSTGEGDRDTGELGDCCWGGDKSFVTSGHFQPKRYQIYCPCRAWESSTWAWRGRSAERREGGPAWAKANCEFNCCSWGLKIVISSRQELFSDDGSLEIEKSFIWDIHSSYPTLCLNSTNVIDVKNEMVPLEWQKRKCPKTFTKFSRHTSVKCLKHCPLFP